MYTCNLKINLHEIYGGFPNQVNVMRIPDRIMFKYSLVLCLSHSILNICVGMAFIKEKKNHKKVWFEMVDSVIYDK